MTRNVSTAMRLLGELYQSAVDINSLSRFLERFSAHMECPSALLRFYETPNNHVQYSLHYGYDPHWQQAYNDYYYQLDPNLEVLSDNPSGLAYSGELVTRRTEYKHSEYYNDYVCKIDKPHAIGGYVIRTPELTGMMALQRSKTDRPFSAEEIDYLTLFFPHFHKAWLLYREFSETRFANRLQERLLNHSRHGLILFDEQARPVYLSERAELLRASGELRFDQSEIFVGSTRHPVRINPLIKAAIGYLRLENIDTPLSLRTTTAIGGKPLIITAMPITPEALGDQTIQARYRAVLVITIPGDCTSADRQLLSTLYGLTPAESELALALANGQNLKDIAQRRRVSRNTLKSQLTAIFRKTDCTRQTELFRLISTLPPAHI